MIGLPLSDDFMGPAVIFSRGIAIEAYALVSARNQPIAGIDDLKGKRVAVQYLTTPQNLLAERDDIEKVTVLTPEDGMKALDQGKADVGFIWGPVAGWLNKSAYGNRYKIQSTEAAACHGMRLSDLRSLRDNCAMKSMRLCRGLNAQSPNSPQNTACPLISRSALAKLRRQPRRLRTKCQLNLERGQNPAQNPSRIRLLPRRLRTPN